MKTKQLAADPGMSDEAVRAKTGKNWAEWLAVLDQAGALQMMHQEIATYLHDTWHCPPWWSQMITVGYERVRGLREKNQAADGYQMSVSKTISVPVAELFQAWHNARTRKRWLPDAKLTVRKAAPNKSLRLSWGEEASSLEVQFVARGEHKSQVSVSQRKLEDAGEVARVKEYWHQALDRLKDLLAARS